MNEANVMLPYSGKEEPILPAPMTLRVPPPQQGPEIWNFPHLGAGETQFCQCNCLCFTSWSHSYAVPSV